MASQKESASKADAKDAPLVADDFPEPEPTIVRSRSTERYVERMEKAVAESLARPNQGTQGNQGNQNAPGNGGGQGNQGAGGAASGSSDGPSKPPAKK